MCGWRKNLLMAMVFAGGIACAVPEVSAQTTTGNSANGGSLWSGKSCNNCHSIGGSRLNAADAGGHLLYAISQGMPASRLASAGAIGFANSSR